MSIFGLGWACKVAHYVQEVDRQCTLVGYCFSGAVVARFLINFVYACMDIIRLQISDFPPLFLCVVLDFSSASPLCDSN